LLSEKADNLKNEIKSVKDEISTENTRIETIKASNQRIQQSIESLERKQKIWDDTKTNSLKDLEKSIELLSNINIENEIANQRLFSEWAKNKKDRDNINSNISKLSAAVDKEHLQLKKLEKELDAILNHRCHSCGQDVHDDKNQEMLQLKNKQITDCNDSITELLSEKSELEVKLKNLGEEVACPEIFYDDLEQALDHKNTLDSLLKDLEKKNNEQNPYNDQIDELKNVAMQDVEWNRINELTRIKDHQEFLLKLLTSKDSFVRKKIIDQNLAFLNQRLTYYLDKIGLPHIVEFQNDLSVIITQLGQDLDFDNLSRGERNRLILSMSWAFRDVWENLYDSINLLFIDELVDSGMDAFGVESSISILKKMTRERDKNVFLISHRDDLAGRVNQVLRVVKENGFTSYSNDIEIVE